MDIFSKNLRPFKQNNYLNLIMLFNNMLLRVIHLIINILLNNRLQKQRSHRKQRIIHKHIPIIKAGHPTMNTEPRKDELREGEDDIFIKEV